MGEGVFQQPPNPREMIKVGGFGVAATEPGENTDDLGVTLGGKDGEGSFER